MNNEIIEEIFNTILQRGSFEAYYQYPDHTKTAIGLKGQGYLISPHVNPNIYLPSKLGEEVLQSGGWKSYIEQKEKQRLQLDKMQHYEFQNVKLKYYSFWPVLILATIGGVYSSIQIINSLSTPKPNTERKIKEQKKVIVSKLHTSSETQRSLNGLPLKSADTTSRSTKS